MIVFILQSLFLIAAAFIAGAILGNIFKRFSRKSESVSEHSTRAADARLASIASLGIAANDDISKSAREAAAMVPPAEPVPAINPVPAKSPRRAVKKSAAKSAAREKNPRQDEKNRPPVLKAARRGKPDQLIAIDGIGNTIQLKLYELGIFHYDQIAEWTVEQAVWVSEEIGFPGRAHRESWIRQAAALVKPATKAVKPKPAPRKTAAKPAGTRKSG
jgi:predicted flap endonuclease-1-like 5' DNA nuclease